jgi:hypothetical protein
MNATHEHHGASHVCTKSQVFKNWEGHMWITKQGLQKNFIQTCGLGLDEANFNIFPSLGTQIPKKEFFLVKFICNKYLINVKG